MIVIYGLMDGLMFLRFTAEDIHSASWSNIQNTHTQFKYRYSFSLYHPLSAYRNVLDLLPTTIFPNYPPGGNVDDDNNKRAIEALKSAKEYNVVDEEDILYRESILSEYFAAVDLVWSGLDICRLEWRFILCDKSAIVRSKQFVLVSCLIWFLFIFLFLRSLQCIQTNWLFPIRLSSTIEHLWPIWINCRGWNRCLRAASNRQLLLANIWRSVVCRTRAVQW